METYEITAELNLKRIIAEAKEVAQALNEFADNLEQIEKKYADPKEVGSDEYTKYNMWMGEEEANK